MTRDLEIGAWALLAVGASGCMDPGVCTLEAVPAVVVEIRSAEDDTRLAAGARGAVHDGTFTDSLRPHRGIGDRMVSRSAAHERAGVYTVRVEHEGYAAWTAEGVRVPRGECHVMTAELTARLEPAP